MHIAFLWSSGVMEMVLKLLE